MPPLDDFEQLLNSVLIEWNRAEEDIKIAEQVANKVVNPSIKELRYAGRRIVEALIKFQKSAPNHEISALLNDALFDCYRARHDAIDAGTSKIAIDLDIMTSKLGYEVILPVHPAFPKLFQDLQKIREKIIESRRDRENRENIYSVLEVSDFPALVKAFNELKGNEHMMIAMAKRRRRSELIGIVGGIAAVLAIFVAFLLWYFPRG
jgi:hypothetical protein